MSLEVSSAVGVGDAVELSVGAHGADGEGTAAEASSLIAVGVLCAVVGSVSLGEGANGDSSIGGSIGGSVLG